MGEYDVGSSAKIWIWLFGGLALIFAYRSTRAVMHLQAEPPAEFMDVRPEWDAKQRRIEERLAQAYWQCAVKVMQQRYPFSTLLPGEPPPEFKIDARAFPDLPPGISLERDRYWQNLRKVWVKPEAWSRTYELDTNWFTGK
jgi:hypothetical protein